MHIKFWIHNIKKKIEQFFYLGVSFQRIPKSISLEYTFSYKGCLICDLLNVYGDNACIDVSMCSYVRSTCYYFTNVLCEPLANMLYFVNKMSYSPLVTNKLHRIIYSDCELAYCETFFFLQTQNGGESKRINSINLSSQVSGSSGPNILDGYYF